MFLNIKSPEPFNPRQLLREARLLQCEVSDFWEIGKEKPSEGDRVNGYNDLLISFQVNKPNVIILLKPGNISISKLVKLGVYLKV